MEARGHAGQQDEVRVQMHRMWSSVAAAWEEHADDVDSRSTATTERLLDVVELRPGDRVLELACGPGGVGLAAARRAGPGSEVVLSDVSPEMAAVAERRACTLELGNVVTRVRDLERIDEPDASFDVALCRHGLMFAADPAAAVSEIARILRPGGRLGLVVWGRRERNPWIGIMLDAVSAQLGAPVPPPGIPGPFSLADADRLAALLRDDGSLDGVVVADEPVSMGGLDFDHWWRMQTALAGPLSGLLAALPADALESIRSRAREAAEPYATADGLELPGLALLASGRRRA